MAARVYQASIRARTVTANARVYSASVAAKPPDASRARVYRARIETIRPAVQNWFVADKTLGRYRPIRWWTKRNGAFIEVDPPE